MNISNYSQACLAKVDANLTTKTKQEHDLNLQSYNLFLSTSEIIDGKKVQISQGILKHMHHRSVELPQIEINNELGLFSSIRLKGAGPYSGPKPEWMYKIRNIRKDLTGLILGLQSFDEFYGAFSSSDKLFDLGIETELPLELHEIFISTREGVNRVNIADAFTYAELPEEYKQIPFVIRIDAIGINHRLKDYIFAENLFETTQANEERIKFKLGGEKTKQIIFQHEKEKN